MKRNIFDVEYQQLRETTCQYLERGVIPNVEKWERDRVVDRFANVVAGKYELFGFDMREEYGGGGSDH
ncbi:hypothetical protein A4G26_14785 [Mycobacterium kansasii]|uniref:Acyl-CoA dehydrogenase/oxidase N-terminal domain-containing protein n=1 Tax=Mycobacterium innocens TaxID=2341083 RepID=A0A498QI58_9MYCO|nr:MULTISPECIES: acyl-CoA dehydrogenase family protein [Mycobacterium]KZS57869.1 hypothetical protein A4G26_14785 [Mycobacterium kansasii]VBA46087.1 hypothetical protein LAUMK13_05597 [Mycobacterium innocens]